MRRNNSQNRENSILPLQKIRRFQPINNKRIIKLHHRHQEQKLIQKFCKRPHSASTIMSDTKIYPPSKESTTTTILNCANISTSRESERNYSNNNNTVLVQVHLPVDDSGRKINEIIILR